MALRCALIHRHTMENKLYEPVQRGLAYGIDTEIDWRAYMEQVEQRETMLSSRVELARYGISLVCYCVGFGGYCVGGRINGNW